MSDESHDHIDENVLLASAYIDDEATPDERALVETSTEALAHVDEFSQLRAVLDATTPRPALSERERHLAGALDAFERLGSGDRSESTPAGGVDGAAAAALRTPESTSDGRRNNRSTRRSVGSVPASQWLLGAAAVLVVVAGGAAVVRGIVGQDSGDEQVAVEVLDDDAPQLSELEADEAAEVAGENVGGDFVPEASELDGDVATDPDGGLFPEADAESEDAMEEAATGPADATADDSADAATGDRGSEQPAPPPETDRIDLQTLDDLADYGSLVVPAASGGPRTTDDVEIEPPFDSCEAEFGVEQLLEPASYRGQDVIVGVDLDEELVYAYTENCELVAVAPLPDAPTP